MSEPNKDRMICGGGLWYSICDQMLELAGKQTLMLIPACWVCDDYSAKRMRFKSKMTAKTAPSICSSSFEYRCLYGRDS